jgi:hypothetical protein
VSCRRWLLFLLVLLLTAKNDKVLARALFPSSSPASITSNRSSFALPRPYLHGSR